MDLSQPCCAAAVSAQVQFGHVHRRLVQRNLVAAAPGVDIIAAAPGGAYDVSSATSLAAAHVSGIAALMLERNPQLTAPQIRAVLTASTQKLKGEAGQDAGAGIADAAAALAAVKK